MPSLEDDILDCVIYLYPSEEDAEQGVEAGGTGFLVSIHAENEKDYQYEHLYAVTNLHVVGEGEEQGRSPVIRLNTQAGEHDVYPMGFEHWIPHPDGADLAVHYFGLVKHDIFRYRSINTEMFISQQNLRRLRVGPGSDVFMVGRFFLQEGTQRNTPSVRFGNVSMMPWEPVQHPSGIDQESFIVEMRTISGYSGSPVFLEPYSPPTQTVDESLLRNFGTVRLKQAPGKTQLSNAYLLGVDWGHIPFEERVLKRVVTDDGIRYDETEFVAEAHSGQSGVIPAWVLYKFLYSGGFQEMRKESEKNLAEEKAKSVR